MVECLLCLEANNDVNNCIQVDSAKWQEYSIKKLIDKHFWPIDTIAAISCLCSWCWKELNDFHKFYIRIEGAHNHLKSVLKTETDPLEEESKPKDLLYENLLEPEIVIGQTSNMSIVIKQENEEPSIVHKSDMSDNDDENYRYLHDDDLEFNDVDSRDSSNESESSDNDLPLIRRNSTKPAVKIRLKRNVTAKDKSNAVRLYSEIKKGKSHYHPKTNRSEYDKFLQDHFQLTCNNCHQTFEKFSLLCKHNSTEHNERGFVMCCQMKFFNRRLLVDHINYHLNPEYFKCLQCGKVFPKRRCLMAHLKSHEEMKHCCDVCDKKFVEKSKLDRHKLTHLSEEEKKFPCNECGKFFANEYVLTLHTRVTHLNIYSKVCEICGQTLPDSNTFKRHMEKHDTTSPSTSFKCDECGLILSGKRTLKRHKDLKHTVGGKTEYSCDICMKVSPNLKALKKHIRCTHEMGYNYKCTLCEKAFKRSDNLKAHMSTHTGAPLYRCPWCPKEFNSNGNMHNHRKKAHPIEWEDARRKKYSGNLPPDFKPPTKSKSQYVPVTFDVDRKQNCK